MSSVSLSTGHHTEKGMHPPRFCKGKKHHHRGHSPPPTRHRHRGPHRSHHHADKLRVKPSKPSKKVRKLHHKLFKRGLRVRPYHHPPPQLEGSYVSSHADYDHPPGCCLHYPVMSMTDGMPLSKEQHRPPPHEMGVGPHHPHPRHHHGRPLSKEQHRPPPHEMGVGHHHHHRRHHLGHHRCCPHPHSRSPPPRRHAHKRRPMRSSIRSEIVGAGLHLPPLCPLSTSAAELPIDTGGVLAPSAILTGDEAAPSALAP